MDKREALKSMLNNLINDKSEEAALDFHNYATAKMRDVAGLAPTEEVPTEVETEVNAEVPTEVSTEVSTDVPAETPATE